MTVKIHNLYLGIKRVGLGLMILAMLQGPCVWGMTFSVYAMESFSNLQYQIGSEDVLSGSYPPREGLGIALNTDIFNIFNGDVGASVSFERYNAKTSDVIGEFVGISAFSGNGVYTMPYQKNSKIYVSAGLNYSFWLISNRFSKSNPSGLGYQGAAGLILHENFGVELGYHKFKAVESNFAETLDNNEVVLKDFWIDSRGIYLKISYFMK